MLTGWFRQLDKDRLEISLRVQGVENVDDLKIRASGSEVAMYELVDFFERRTGLSVNAEWRRIRRGPKPMAGQLEMMEQT